MKKKTAVIVISILSALVIVLGALLYIAVTADRRMPAVGEAPSPAPTPEPGEDGEIAARLAAFFTHWNGNRLDDMLELCHGDWKAAQENPKTRLFTLMGNRTPQEYTAQKISGAESDPERTVTVIALMDRHNGKEPVEYLLQIVMRKGTDGLWYVDPSSLGSQERYGDIPPEEKTPVPAPDLPPETILYYVPDVGEYYHLDPACRKVNAHYLPMENSFTAGETGQEPYAGLIPCDVCVMTGK